MKGIVFTEFLDYVDATCGRDMVDDILDDCSFPHGGAYTAVGTYPYQEMVALVGALSKRTKMGPPDLLCGFGRHLCGRFAHLYPEFFENKKCLFDFLESVNGHIHVEVYKLYPDAELPAFETHARTAANLELDYRSCKPLASFAEGLIKGASDIYREPVVVSHERREETGDAFVRFSIKHA
jgi:hypothetical protein